MYDANASYEENYKAGPRGRFDASGRLPRLRYVEPPRYAFLGVPLHVPFGMPAGPLLNARYVRAALEAGFCLPVYKTVRTRAWKSHPYPNVLAIEGEGRAALSALRGVGDPDRVVGRPFEPADYARPSDLSISNSFGVPSRAPAEWDSDYVTLGAPPPPFGSVVVLSFQGTRPEGVAGEAGFEAFVEDAARAGVLAFDAATRVSPGPSAVPTPALLEINLSCPNEAGAPVFKDVERSLALLAHVRSALDARARESGAMRAKFVAKIGVLDDASCLRYVRGGVGIVDAFSAINTISARILGPGGGTVLGAGVETGGVCGRAIFRQALEVIEKLSAARRASRLTREELAIVGVGGVRSAREFGAFLAAGADAVQAATGAMWNLGLAAEVARSLAVPFESLEARP